VVLVFAGMTRSVGFSFAGITASFAAVVACGSPRGEARHHFCIRSHVSVGGRCHKPANPCSPAERVTEWSRWALRGGVRRQKRTFRIRDHVTTSTGGSGAGARCRRLRAVGML